MRFRLIQVSLYVVFLWQNRTLKFADVDVQADGAKFLSHIIVCIFAAFSSKLGYEEHIPGQTRDWNEELQTTRELPRKNLPERLLRERAIFKVSISFKESCLKTDFMVPASFTVIIKEKHTASIFKAT
jgi:hypothetical protein